MENEMLLLSLSCIAWNVWKIKFDGHCTDVPLSNYTKRIWLRFTFDWENLRTPQYVYVDVQSRSCFISSSVVCTFLLLLPLPSFVGEVIHPIISCIFCSYLCFAFTCQYIDFNKLALKNSFIKSESYVSLLVYRVLLTVKAYLFLFHG